MPVYCILSPCLSRDRTRTHNHQGERQIGIERTRWYRSNSRHTRRPMKCRTCHIRDLDRQGGPTHTEDFTSLSSDASQTLHMSFFNVRVYICTCILSFITFV